MKRLYRILALLVLPLFALRFSDIVRNINTTTGFYDSGDSFLRILSLLVVAAVVLLMRLRVKNANVSLKTSPRANAVCGIFFFLSAVTISLSSFLQMLRVFAQANFRELFMSKKDLFLAGFESTHFRIEFWCALVGFITGLWFLLGAIRFFFRDGDLSGQPFFSCVPIVWYCLRAISDFSIAPVNPNNALIITCIATSLILGIFYLRYARFISLRRAEKNAPSLSEPHADTDADEVAVDRSVDDARRMIPYALLAFVFTIAFKGPLVAVLPVESTDMVLAIADCCTAFSAFVATDIIMKGPVKRRAKPQVD